jgi:O-antigen/teichoic acid export membrane protein
MLRRAFAANILGQAASLGLGFIASLVLARWLGPSDRGLLAIILSLSTVAYVLVSVGLPLSVEYHAARGGPGGRLLGNTLAWGVGIAVTVIPAVWLLRDWIADTFGHGRGGGAWVLAAVLVPITFVQWTTGNQLSGLLRFGFFNLLFAALRAVYLVAALVLLALGLGVSAGVLATILASLVMTFAALPVILRGQRLGLDGPLMRSMLSFGARHQVGLIFQTLNYRLDVVILQFFRPLAAVGYYVVAQVIAELVTTLGQAFESSVLPLVTREEVEGQPSATTQSALRHHAVLALVAIAGVAALGPPLIYFGFGPSFQRAIVPMLILLPGMWFLGTGGVVGSSLGGRGRPGTRSLLAGVGLIATITLDLTLIPLFGVNGAAVASTVAYSIYGCASLVVLSRMTGLTVRELVVPTRSELSVYPSAFRAAIARVRS